MGPDALSISGVDGSTKPRAAAPSLGPPAYIPSAEPPVPRRLGRGCNGGCGLSRLRGPRPLVQPPKPAIAGQSHPKYPHQLHTPMADHGDPAALTSWGISCSRMAMVVRSPIWREGSGGGSVLRAPTCPLILPVSALGALAGHRWAPRNTDANTTDQESAPEKLTVGGGRGKGPVNTEGAV